MKKVISLSSVLAILLSQAGCVGDNSSQEKPTETEKTTQGQKQVPISNKEPQIITLTNNMTGQEIKIPLDEFKKMSRHEFAEKLGVSKEEVDKVSDEEFDKQKQALVNMVTLGEELKDHLQEAFDKFGEAVEEANKPSVSEQDAEIFAQLSKNFPPEIAALASKAKSINGSIDHTGGTLLHWGSRMGHMELVRFLLKEGARIDPHDEDGRTPLIEASFNGHAEIVDLLLKSGAEVDARTRYGRTALMNACGEGHTAVVELLVAAGADVNAKVPAYQNWTPLMFASEHGHSDTIQALLAAGAAVNTLDSGNSTALMFACYSRNLEAVKVLLRAGANINAVNGRGETALNFAQRGNNEDVIGFLRIHGAKTKAEMQAAPTTPRAQVAHTTEKTNNNTTDKKQLQSKFVDICRWGAVGEVSSLLKMGADVNEESLGQSPLKNAILGDQVQIVKLLLQHGATVTPSLVALAENHKNTEIVNLLKSAGAKE